MSFLLGTFTDGMFSGANTVMDLMQKRMNLSEMQSKIDARTKMINDMPGMIKNMMGEGYPGGSGSVSTPSSAADGLAPPPVPANPKAEPVVLTPTAPPIPPPDAPTYSSPNITTGADNVPVDKTNKTPAPYYQEDPGVKAAPTPALDPTKPPAAPAATSETGKAIPMFANRAYAAANNPRSSIATAPLSQQDQAFPNSRAAPYLPQDQFTAQMQRATAPDQRRQPTYLTALAGAQPLGRA